MAGITAVNSMFGFSACSRTRPVISTIVFYLDHAKTGGQHQKFRIRSACHEINLECHMFTLPSPPLPRELESLAYIPNTKIHEDSS